MRHKIPVYIHTRDRFKFLDKILPKWLAQPSVGHISLVVEPDEYWPTYRYLNQLKARSVGASIGVMKLSQTNAGMGAARAEVVRRANSKGERIIIMADDDLWPKDDVLPLYKHVLETGAIGIGVCVSFYGLALGNDFIKESSEVVPVSGAWGYRLFALNIPAVIANGMAYGLDWGFDPALDVGWEDHEITRMAIATQHVMWAIHTGVHANSIGARYAPGGIADLIPDKDERHAREEECHRRIWARWGGTYISSPEKKYRCNWSRLLKDHGLKDG